MAKEPRALGPGQAKLVLEFTGIGRVLRSDEIKDDIRGRTERIAESADALMETWTNTGEDNTGDQNTSADNTEGEVLHHEARVYQGRDRVRGVVITQSLDAIISEQYNRTLTRAIDAGRGSVDV